MNINTCIHIISSRTPALGGISLALRGNGAPGAALRAPSAPRLGRPGRPFCAAFGGGKRKKKFGAPGAPMVLKTSAES